ncbi:CHAP domain-containing protein [Nocardioides anomalus]|uniref:CHAP domain-containing protein n=1 Tax=Nocardioides anomalus TaxID=2712223 RepID=A0A6G6WHD9_9ACTN|nr:CHAP domain-containing protein [Nocardioides anomalus]QIG44654.1 CHAP domain-containing protein [Nocardioides anomalus]
MTISNKLLGPGEPELVESSVPKRSRCSLTATHSGSRRTAPKQVRSRVVLVETGRVQFSWTTARHALAGTWRLSVACRAKKANAARVVAHGVVKVGAAGKGHSTSKRDGTALTRRVEVDVMHASTDGIGASGCEPTGTVLVRAGDWMQSRGGGVDVFSNGPKCTSLSNPYQCVELVNRLITAKGWSTRIRGDAWEFWDHASKTDFEQHPNGSGYIPVPGDVIVWYGSGDIGQYGHVQVVDSVSGSTVHVVQQNSAGARADLQISASGAIGGRSWPGNSEYVKGFLHAKKNVLSAAQAFNGHIVQWDGDRKTQKTAWWVSGGKRYWIPTSAVYYCLKNSGAPGPDVLTATVLDSLPDQNGAWVRCDSSGTGVGSGPPPTETDPGGPVDPNPPQPPPAPTTWAETTGSVAHTWTNYTNAGGSEGPTIASNQTVQIACKLTGFRVADGNTWWYRIAQSPWNGAYYVSADAFYNNGATSGSLRGTPFVDNNVANC